MALRALGILLALVALTQTAAAPYTCPPMPDGLCGFLFYALVGGDPTRYPYLEVHLATHAPFLAGDASAHAVLVCGLLAEGCPDATGTVDLRKPDAPVPGGLAAQAELRRSAGGTPAACASASAVERACA